VTLPSTNIQTGPKRRNADETRARLLRVAETLFADQGFDRTTIASIAEAAGVTKAMVRYYYGDKAGLHAAVIDAVVTEVLAQLEADLPEQADPRRSMADFIEVFAMAIISRPSFPRMLVRDYLDGDLMARPATASTLMQFMNKTRLRYEAGRDAGVFRELNPHMLHLSIVSNAAFFSLTARFRAAAAAQGVKPDTGLEAADFARHLRTLLLDGIGEENIVLR
jgi:AcrR family transcriptional regulator